MASKLHKTKKQPSVTANSAPTHEVNDLQFILVVAIVVFFLFRIFSSKKRSFGRRNRFINQWGYVVLREENELEHRYIAMQLLGRDLASNEVVHHINGKKTDNKVRNLCLMDREKHELFHAWLRWRKEKNGRYPIFKDQERILENEYGGTLLENIKPLAQIDRTALQKKLFEGLREERRRIAEAQGVPVYIIFNNKTLEEIAENMPVTETLLLKISGVDPEKFRLYGAHFISVVKKFKNAG